MSLAAEAFVSQIAASEPWPENATLYQPLRDNQILLSDCASSLAVQAYLRMCDLPLRVCCRANAEHMSPSGNQNKICRGAGKQGCCFGCCDPTQVQTTLASDTGQEGQGQGKVPFIHVGNQVVSELGPIIQFTKAKGHSLSDVLDDVQRAEMKAYMELVNNMLLTAELYIQWCDETTAAEITRPRYSSPYPWPLKPILAYQKQWEVRRKMSAVGWAEKTLEQVYEDVAQCCQALSQRLGTQMYFFNRQPTELDALVFGHLFTILTTQLTSNELSDKVKTYRNLLTFVHRIEQTYFEGLDQAGQSGAGPWAPPEV